MNSRLIKKFAAGLLSAVLVLSIAVVQLGFIPGKEFGLPYLSTTYGHLLFILPFVLLIYVLWRFVKPDLANSERRRSGSYLPDLLHALPDSIWWLDLTGKLLSYIPGSGSDPFDGGDWVGRSLFDALPRDVAERTLSFARLSFEKGEPQVFEFSIMRNGSIQHFENRVICSGSEILTICRDITELRHIEAESHVMLEISQGVSGTSNLQELLRHIHGAISKYIYAENCFVALFDATSEMLSMEFFVDKYDKASAPQKLGRGLTAYVLRAGCPMLLSSQEIRQLMGLGEVQLIGTIPAVWMGIPLRTRDGVVGVLVLQHYSDGNVYGRRDLALLSSVGEQIAVAIERKRSEEAVEISRDYLDEIINVVADPIFVKDRLHQWTLVNDAFCEFIGHRREELIGRSDYDFFPEHEADVFWEKDEIVFASRKENRNEEQITNAKGETRRIISRKTLYTDREGNEFIVAVINDITPMKNVEKALEENIRSKEESLALLDTILSTAPIGFAFHNPDLTIERLNYYLAEINGLSAEEHRGKKLSEIVPELGAIVEPVIEKILETGEPMTDLELEGKTQADPGRMHHWLANFYPVKTSAGEMLGVGVLVQDVTERKMIENELQESREYLDRIINLVATPIYVCDEDSRLVLVNEAFCAMLRRERAAALGMTPADFFPPDEAEKISKRNRECIETGLGSSYEDRVRDADGNLFVFLTSRSLYRSQNGERFVVGVISDLSERARADEILLESEAQFRDLFDNAPIAYHELDIEGRFTRVNRTEQILLGYTEEELKGRHPAEIVADPICREATAAKLAGNMSLQAVERTFIRKDGSFISVLNEDRLIYDPEGNLTGLRSTLQDITERKLLEEKLQRSQKLESIGQLAAGIAHEINTPTQYVGDNVRFLRDGFEDLLSVANKAEELLSAYSAADEMPDAALAMRQAIERSDIEYLKDEVPRSFAQALDGVERIRKIVQSMKDFAHPGSTDKKFTDLNRAIESTLTVASNEWKYVADVVRDYDETLPNVPCLVGEINQVFLNIIVNAAHAIADAHADIPDEKGTITISTRRVGEFAEIRISDNGPGIPDDVRSRIFDPFFTTKEVGRGTGQGLAISHTVIVEKHRGTIDVETEVGKGTTFVISLPAGENFDDESGSGPEIIFEGPERILAVH